MFQMHLCFRSKHLHVLGNVWGEVLHGPGSENRMLILKCVSMRFSFLSDYGKMVRFRICELFFLFWEWFQSWPIQATLPELSLSVHISVSVSLITGNSRPECCSTYRFVLLLDMPGGENEAPHRLAHSRTLEVFITAKCIRCIRCSIYCSKKSHLM